MRHFIPLLFWSFTSSYPHDTGGPSRAPLILKQRPVLGNSARPRWSPPPGFSSEKDVCTHLAQYACDPAINPAIGKVEKALATFDGARNDALQSPEIQAFIRANGGDQRCATIKARDASKACTGMVEKILSESFYTQDRRTKANDLFVRAKGSMLAYLADYAKSLPFTGREGKKAILDQMKAKIESAVLSFGPVSVSQSSSFNAAASAEKPEKDQTLLEKYVTGAKQNTIVLEGSIALVDEAPMALYRTLLHEFSHFLDPGKFRGNDQYDGSVFSRELQCLKRPESAGAKSGDAECFAQRAKALEGSDKLSSELCATCAQKLKANPDATVGNPLLDEGQACQEAQIGEAFADWLASDVYSFESRASLQALMRDKDPSHVQQSPTGERFLSPMARFAKTPELLESIALYCSTMHRESQQNISHGSHPLGKDRLDGTMLAEPYTKFAMGCSSETVWNARYEDDRKSAFPEGTRTYCGMGLYLPFKI